MLLMMKTGAENVPNVRAVAGFAAASQGRFQGFLGPKVAAHAILTTVR